MNKTIYSIIFSLVFFGHQIVVNAQWINIYPKIAIDNISWMVSDENYLFAGALNNLNNSAHSIIRSSDNGINWEPADTILYDSLGLKDGSINALTYFNGVIFAAFDGNGIYCSSNNGTNWSLSDSGIPNIIPNDTIGVSIYTFDTCNGKIFVSFNTTYTYGGEQYKSLYCSTNNGVNWVPSDAGLSMDFISARFLNIGDTIYDGTYSNGIYFSTNDGFLWSFFALPNQQINAMAAIDNILFISYADSIIVNSSDNGISWNNCNNGLPGSAHLPFYPPNGVSYLLPVGNILFAATDSGIYYSRNKGIYWNTLDSPSNQANGNLFYYNNYLFAAGGNKIFRRPLSDYMHPKSAISLKSDSLYFNVSQGKGTYDDTLTITNLGDTTLFIDSIIINDKNISITYFDTAGAGGQIQIIVQLTYAGQPDTVKELIIASNDPVHPFDTVYVVISSKTGVNESAMPESFGLSVYPNPFSSTAQLHYSVAHEGNVSLTIVNEMGAVVATLVNGRQAPGVHTAVLDGGALPAGAYFARYMCGAQVIVKPMVVMR